MTTVSAETAVLVVYPFCLDHVGHGNIQRLLAVADDLASHGVAVDLIYQGSSRVAPVDAQYAAFRRVIAVHPGLRSSDDEACERRLLQFYAGFDLPPQHLRPSPTLTSLARALLDSQPYAAVLATYAFTAPIFHGLNRRVLTICDVQDILHEHAQACVDRTGASSAFSLPAATEAYLWRQWDLLLAITPEDAQRIRPALLPGQRVIVARHAAACVPSAAPGDDDVAFYAGSDNQSNVGAVSWLLEEVWPKVRARRPSARLRIAGLICAGIPEPLKATPGVELLGFLPDVDDAIAQCGVLVAPYLYGSGLKIKVVEAAAAGKAIVTTPSGIVGSGLTAGVAVAVTEDAAGFADTLASWLGDRHARATAGDRALREARALYSVDACYGALRVALDLYRRDAQLAAPHAVAPASVKRVERVVELVRPARLVLWGNGSHTRALVNALASAGIGVDAIVDGRAAAAGRSPEGLPVWAAEAVELADDDLIVLSSETFEHEMWRDLVVPRRRGAMVMGLTEPRRLSAGILARLPAAARAEFDPAPSEMSRATPTLVVWDSRQDMRPWWRLSAVEHLARAYVERRGRPIVVTSRGVAGGLLEGGTAGIQLLPLIEVSGERLELDDPDGGARGLVRATDAVIRFWQDGWSRVQFRSDDLLVLMEPALSECLAVARLLEGLPGAARPHLVVWAAPPNRTPGPEGRAIEACWRLAASALAERVGGRLAVVTPEGADGPPLQAVWGMPVAIVGHPRLSMPDDQPVASLRVLCVGNVSWPAVQPALTAFRKHLSAAGVSAAVAWRSEQDDGRAGARESWARDVAAALDVRLLDQCSPREMEHAVAGADLVVELDPVERPWSRAVRARAQAAGIPVVAAADAGELVRRIHPRRLLPGRDADDWALGVLDALAVAAGGLPRGHAGRESALTVPVHFAMEMRS